MNFRYSLLTHSASLLLCLGLQTANGAEPPPGLGSSLEDFYAAALEFNPALEISEQRWQVQTARKDQIRGRLLPQISASASQSENSRTEANNPTRDYEGTRYGVQLQQVLFNWQSFQATKRASLEEDQAEAQYYAQLATLLTDVADKYLLVLQAEDALRSIDAQVDAMSNQVGQIQSLYDRQLAQVTDLYDGQAKLAAVRAEKVAAESDLELARARLQAVSNLDVGALYQLPADSELPPLPGDLELWLDKARNNNLVIAAYTYGLQAAEKQVSERRGTHLPTVSLVVQQQHSNLGFDNQPLSEYDSTYVGLNLSVPLFAGGSNSASVREAQSLRNIAASELRQARLQMLENTRTSYLQVRAGESRIESKEALAESTETAYSAMQRGYELGTVTSVDLLNALRDHFQAERELQTARYDYIRSLLMLRREAGELDAEDLEEISDLLQPVR